MIGCWPHPEENRLEKEEQKNILHRCEDKEQIKLGEKRDAPTLRRPSSRETESDPAAGIQSIRDPLCPIVGDMPEQAISSPGVRVRACVLT